MSELILPNEQSTKINVNSNELINYPTINRGLTRLLDNDKQLRDWIEIDSDKIDSVSGDIGKVIVNSTDYFPNVLYSGNVNSSKIFPGVNVTFSVLETGTNKYVQINSTGAGGAGASSGVYAVGNIVPNNLAAFQNDSSVSALIIDSGINLTDVANVVTTVEDSSAKWDSVYSSFNTSSANYFGGFDYFNAQGQAETKFGYIDYTSYGSGTAYGALTDYAVDYADSSGNITSVSATVDLPGIRSIYTLAKLFPQNSGDNNKPLVRPSGCKQTEVIVQYYVNEPSYSSGTTDDAHLHLLIDWVAQKFYGEFTIFNTTISANTKMVLYSGLSFGQYQFSYTTSNYTNRSYQFYDLVPPLIYIDDDRIYKLPCWAGSSGGVTYSETTAFSLHIKHYR